MANAELNFSKNHLLYGDCLDMLQLLDDEVVDLIYLDPPFNSNQNYNMLFGDETSQDSAQITAFADTWYWQAEHDLVYDRLLYRGGTIGALTEALLLMLGRGGMQIISSEVIIQKISAMNCSYCLVSIAEKFGFYGYDGNFEGKISANGTPLTFIGHELSKLANSEPNSEMLAYVDELMTKNGFTRLDLFYQRHLNEEKNRELEVKLIKFLNKQRAKHPPTPK